MSEYFPVGPGKPAPPIFDPDDTGTPLPEGTPHWRERRYFTTIEALPPGYRVFEVLFGQYWQWVSKHGVGRARLYHTRARAVKAACEYHREMQARARASRR